MVNQQSAPNDTPREPDPTDFGIIRRGRGSDPDRSLAVPLQHQAPQLTGLSASGPENGETAMAALQLRFAPPAASYSARANLTLTINVDHLVGPIERARLVMLIELTPIENLLLLTPWRLEDHRGFFAESYKASVLLEWGIREQFVQENHSLSAHLGTVRGLHFQAPPHAQAKLVRCGRGALFDVAVDIRRGSPTYGQWFGAELSFENGRQLYIPAGFAHGFVTRVPDTEIVYKCSDYYAPETEGSLRFDDPDIGIDWGLDGVAPILSEKDAAAGLLATFDSPFTFESNQ